MNIILFGLIIFYCTIAVIFSVLMLSVYQEDKKGWTESDLCNKLGMFVGSCLWPVCLVYGLCKMSKEDDKEIK